MRIPLVLLLAVTIACSDAGGPAPTGSLTVTVLVAAGGTSDPDGSRIAVEGDTVVVPPTGGSAEFDDLSPGTVVVKVLGLSPWCGATPRIQPVEIIAQQTANRSTTIQCNTALGAVRLTTEAAGIDIDPDGYTVTAGGVDHSVGARDTTILSLPSGTLAQIAIRGVRRTCWATSDSTLSATPTLPGDTIDLVFHVDCGVILYQGFTIGGPPRFHQVNVTTGGTRPLGTFANNASGLRSSPDGSQIVFTSDEIFTMPPNGVGPVQRTTTTEIEINPGWSPDGSSLYYTLVEDQILRRLVLGTGAVTAIPGGVAAEGYPASRPQGDLIAYQHSVGDTSRVYLMGSNGSGRHLAFSVGNFLSQPSWSPDGSTLAVTCSATNTSGPIAICVGAPGDAAPTFRSNPPSTSNFDHDPLWSSDGQWIAFVREPGDATQAVLHLMHPDGSGGRTVPIGQTWNGQYTWLR